MYWEFQSIATQASHNMQLGLRDPLEIRIEATRRLAVTYADAAPNKRT